MLQNNPRYDGLKGPVPTARQQRIIGAIDSVFRCFPGIDAESIIV